MSWDSFRTSKIGNISKYFLGDRSAGPSPLPTAGPRGGLPSVFKYVKKSAEIFHI